ncbi:TetR/AcrR family transcriptional regulator [Rhodococcus sp. ACPA4]|nr:TetR/AcrR family transcriptional regulator [Rhodococcus sp. ACPA4]PSR43381.1 TetR/AcrR family transcriptional regulator [Rhodococcus sp. AD45-ID]ROZ50725.1 TetR/AcrR family transcriptional regulator [Rhodococcus sp. WS3]
MNWGWGRDDIVVADATVSDFGTRLGTARMAAVKVNGRTPEAKAFRVERVVKAARELASAGGYEAVQMREVARRAQTALSTLYKYYASKDELITAAVSSELDSLAEDVLRRPPRQRTAEGRAGEVFVRAFVAMVKDPGFAHSVLAAGNTVLEFDPDRVRHSAEVTDITPWSTPFTSIAAVQAWGPDHRCSPMQLRALCMVETLWVASVGSWLNGETSAHEVKRRLRLAAKRLLAADSADPKDNSADNG